MSISSMIRRYIKLPLIAMVLVLPVYSQVPVAPANLPHITFVNGVGAPCAGCSLFSYAAGTTTPLATYVDASGTSTNTNPIILDVAGGANIWFGTNSYKFVLKDTSGATIWTVDQVNAGNLFPCGPAGTIQIANTAVNGLTCDSSITINTTNHTISVGTLPANHVTIGALGTPTSWTFDTTTPATALASLGGAATNAGTINQLAFYASAGTILSGTSVIPAGITATTQSPSDNSGNLASTAYVALPGIINPTSVQVSAGSPLTDNQGTGALIQHSTGTTTTDDCAKFDAVGNTVDSSIPCTGTTVTQTNQTGSRFAGVVYQNTSTQAMYISGYMLTGGSSVGNVSCVDGPTSTPASVLYSNESTATVSGGAAGFSCLIPPSYYYEINVAGTVGSSPANWYETTF